MAGDSSASTVGRFGLIAIAGVAVVLMLSALGVAVLLPGSTSADPSATGGASGSATGFACDESEAEELVPFLEGVAQITPTRVAMLDLTGKVLWSVDISMQTPVGTTAGGRLLVQDPGGFSCAVFDRAGLVWTTETTGHIDGATISASGHVTILTDETGYKGVVGVYSPTGTLLFQWMSSETGYVLSATVDPSGTRVDVTALYTDGASPQPVLKSFTVAGSESFQHTLDAGAALPLIVYDEQGRTVLCGEDSVVGFKSGSSAGDIAYRIDTTGIRTVLASTGGPVYVRASPTGSGTLLARIHNGVEGPTRSLPSMISAIAVRGSLAATATGTSLSVTDVSTGTQTFQTTMVAEVLAIGFSDDHHLVVVTRTAVRQVTVP